MTATPPASWISAIACSAVGQRARDEGLGAGDEVLLEEGAEVAGRAGGPGDVGAADRERVAGLLDRVLELHFEAPAPQPLDDLLRPASTRSCCARSQAGAIVSRSTQ